MWSALEASWTGGGPAGLCACLASQVDLNAETVTRLASRLREDETFLRAFQSCLLQTVYASFCASGDAEARAFAEGWAEASPHTWLRARAVAPHGESSTTLYDSLRLSPAEDAFLILGSQGELWSLPEVRCLWRHSEYMAREVCFTADGAALVGHGIDTAGMSDRNPYTADWDVRSGARIYYSDDYVRAPEPPPGPTVAPSPSALSIARRRAPPPEHWDLCLPGGHLAHLPGRVRSCVGTRDGRTVVAIERDILTVYAVVTGCAPRA